MTDLSNAWNDMDITNIVCSILVHLIIYLFSSRRPFHLFSIKSYPVMLFFSQSTSPAFVKVIHDFHAVKFNSRFSVFILLDLNKLDWYVECSFTYKNCSLDFKNKILFLCVYLALIFNLLFMFSLLFLIY